jgi:hypothetical protein
VHGDRCRLSLVVELVSRTVALVVLTKRKGAWVGQVLGHDLRFEKTSRGWITSIDGIPSEKPQVTLGEAVRFAKRIAARGS